MLQETSSINFTSAHMTPSGPAINPALLQSPEVLIDKHAYTLSTQDIIKNYDFRQDNRYYTSSILSRQLNPHEPKSDLMG